VGNTPASSTKAPAGTLAATSRYCRIAPTADRKAVGRSSKKCGTSRQQKPRRHSSTQREDTMELTARHREYWHKNLVITGILLFVWFVVTFVEAWFARELNAITFLGFPLGFYMSAQGSLIVYVVLIWIYARYMKNLDKQYDVDEGDDRRIPR
jgi:putative solute:sodium symporter small subunit